jgi:putative thioredoxin
MSLPPSAKGLGNFGGAFDLGTLRQPAVTIDPADLGYVVTQNNLVSELLPASNEAVAIILCWSPRSTQAQSLLPMMREFNRDDATATGEPTWIFGSVNVDAEPAVAKALQVQSVPLAIAIIQEQLVPLFESVPPADQVRAVINKVLELAAQKGVGAAPAAPADPVDVIEPEEEAAMAALQAGDYLGAKRSYEEWLKRSPDNDFAKLGLAQVELFIRIDGVDPVDAAKQADTHPEDLAMQIMAADCEIAQGDFAGATSRLISAVRNSAGDDRKQVRDHLLILFTLIEPDDPRLTKARQQLASALF